MHLCKGGGGACNLLWTSNCMWCLTSWNLHSNIKCYNVGFRVGLWRAQPNSNDCVGGNNWFPTIYKLWPFVIACVLYVYELWAVPFLDHFILQVWRGKAFQYFTWIKLKLEKIILCSRIFCPSHLIYRFANSSDLSCGLLRGYWPSGLEPLV